MTFGCSSSGATPQLKPLAVGQSGSEGDGRLSPDGKWIVYRSAESTGGGRDGQIIVRPFPNVDAYQKDHFAGLGQPADLVARRPRDLLSHRRRQRHVCADQNAPPLSF